jgi:hypothetical protein
MLGTSTVTAGTATFSTSTLPVGPGQVTAAYSGDTNYTASTSAVAMVDVTFNGTVTVMAADSVGDQSSASLAVMVQ